MAGFEDTENIVESMPMLADKSDDEENVTTFESKSIKNSPNFHYNVIEQKRGKPRHKILLFFHVALKSVAIIIYLGSNVFHLGYIATFIAVVIILSMDFWLTKNVSGRLLAGLRWWNQVDGKTGEMKWYYESWSAEERSVGRKSQGNNASNKSILKEIQKRNFNIYEYDTKRKIYMHNIRLFCLQFDRFG